MDLILYIIFGSLFVLVVVGFILLPYRHRKWREYAASADSFYELDPIEDDRPLDKKIGKLVRKVVDKPPVWRNGRYMGKRYAIDPIFKKPDFFWKYYLTFETFDGYKSFTVTKDEFNKYRTQTYGYIFYQDTRFSHFEIRNREELNLDELIAKHNKKRS